MGKIVNTAAAVATVASFGIVYYIAIPGSEEAKVTTFYDDISAIQVEEPAISVVSIEDANVELNNVEASNIAEPDKDICSEETSAVAIEDAASDVPRYATMVAEQQALLRDKRNIRYDPALIALDSANWVAWKKIYNNPEYQNYVMEYKPLYGNLRIINEVWAPRSFQEQQTMLRRLAEYRAWNYNAVLVCFDTSENLLDLMCAVDYIKSTGMKVVIVYTGGKETLRDSVFRSPVEIRKFLTALAPRADALLLGWWRTSVHLFIPDLPYTNYIVKSARAANPDLPVIGQAYWGQTAETGSKHENFRVTVALPENASAVLVMGMGYPGVANKQAFDSLFKAVSDHPHKIALVAGEKPYYDTRNSSGKSEQVNRKIKRILELRLLRIGFQSTMTFSGDGSNGIYEENKTENLCLEYAK